MSADAVARSEAAVSTLSARENCIVCKIERGSEAQHCTLCFCYVCDCVVSSCKAWPEHCRARHSDPYWQRQRAKAASAAAAAAAAANAAKAREAQAAADLRTQAALRVPAPPSSLAAAAAGASSTRVAAVAAPTWSCERILAAVTAGSVYANEVS